MEVWEAAALVVAAAAGGAQNAIAGGGSFLTFPSLVLAGLSSVQANATSAVALWPGSLASAAGYREELAHPGARRLNLALGLSSLAGGGLGALLLLVTPAALFDWLVPFLLLVATLLFAAGEPLRRAMGARAEAADPAPLTAALWHFPIAVYGGYFGGGMGMMMLALFALLGMRDVHRMNGLKSLLGVAINGVAIATFAIGGLVVWKPAALMIAGAVIGGYGGARLARRIPQRTVRPVIVVIGLALAALFLLRAARG